MGRTSLPRVRSSARDPPGLPFPLARWIDDHLDLPHNLASSGMLGELRSTQRILRRPPPATPWELREEVASGLEVAPDRVFLTHGATEGATLTLFYLARRLATATGRTPRAGIRWPEYPPLVAIAREAGFSMRGVPDVRIVSSPNNPTGGSSEIGNAAGSSPRNRGAWVVDETFREFTTAPSWGRLGRPGLWCTGTLTKVYGADSVRVGWTVAPPESAADFARFHGVVADGIPPASVSAATSLLRERATVLCESRSIFATNRAALRRAFPATPHLSAPLWFDVGGTADAGDRLAIAGLGAGVLVCPGSFFGNARGVRVTLTRRSFPDDLEAYRALRDSQSGYGRP